MEAATLLLALTATFRPYVMSKLTTTKKTKNIKTNSCIKILTQKPTNMC